MTGLLLVSATCGVHQLARPVPGSTPDRVRLLQPPAEGLEVSGGLPSGAAPLPFAADRGGETQLEDRVERLVGVGQHRTEQPVELLGRPVPLKAVNGPGPVVGSRPVWPWVW